MEEIDIALSAELDRPGEQCPLLTRGEARAARYALHLFGQGDGPGSQAARDLEVRLERRLEVMFPGEDIYFPEELPAPGDGVLGVAPPHDLPDAAVLNAFHR